MTTSTGPDADASHADASHAEAGDAHRAGGSIDPLLLAYDEQLRTDGEVHDAQSVRRHGPLLWALMSDRRGFVTYRDLGGATGAELDELIADTLAHYRDDTDAVEVEWKTRGHDAPDDLDDRLRAHGFEPDALESVMVGEAAGLVSGAAGVRLPEGVTIRRAGEGGDLLDDVRRALAMQAEVFGGHAGPSPEQLALAMQEHPELVELWLAEVDHADAGAAGAQAGAPDGAQVGAQVVCAGRLSVVPGTQFAGIWGGACLPAWRGRGIYRALTAARAASAMRLGARYVHSDSTPMSRPILERSGLRAITTTTPYLWTRP